MITKQQQPPRNQHERAIRAQIPDAVLYGWPSTVVDQVHKALAAGLIDQAAADGIFHDLQLAVRTAAARAKDHYWLEPGVPGFVLRVAEQIARSNASAAYDCPVGRSNTQRMDYATRREAVAAHRQNVVDTMCEYGIGKAHPEHRAGLRAYAAECRAQRAEMAQRRAQHQLKRAAALVAMAKTTERACKRCHQVGNVDHDNEIAICNPCADAIQGGADSHHYDPAERTPAAQATEEQPSANSDPAPRPRTLAARWVVIAIPGNTTEETTWHAYDREDCRGMQATDRAHAEQLAWIYNTDHANELRAASRKGGR